MGVLINHLSTVCFEVGLENHQFLGISMACRLLVQTFFKSVSLRHGTGGRHSQHIIMRPNLFVRSLELSPFCRILVFGFALQCVKVLL